LEARAHGIFLSKVWWNFPKKEQNESNLQKKKNSKIFPIFFRKEKSLSKENHWSSQSDYPFAMIG
jgi:hypothetical protein